MRAGTATAAVSSAMLYLKLAAAEPGDTSRNRIPLSEPMARRLEAALLSGDDASRRRELGQAVAEDSAFAGWALRTAENATKRTINQIDEAADWIAPRLIVELAAALECGNQSESPAEVESRLPALIATLAQYEQRLAEFDRRLEREKLESLKELAYGASHEINNPLANIAARVQTLLPDEADPERARKLVAIHRQAMRAHEMISDLMLFARPPKLDRKRFELGTLVRRVTEEMANLAEESEVELACDHRSEPMMVDGDETQLGVAIQALVRNGLEATPPGGIVQVSTILEEAAEPVAQIIVRDSGPGISDAVRSHIFDPFFSGREAGRGLGFGLSKCWRIVTDHGGQVIADSPAAGGAEFRILLPRC